MRENKPAPLEGTVSAWRFPLRMGERELVKNMAQFMTGGVHLTSPAFLPLVLVKLLTCTECNGNIFLPEQMIKTSVEELDEEQDMFYNMDHYPPDWRNRTIRLDDLAEQDRRDLGYVPWYLACQRNRFPYWFGEHDGRNRDLLEALQAVLADTRRRQG